MAFLATSDSATTLNPDGSFERTEACRWNKHLMANISEGDEILLLPKVDFKRLQITKNISQVIYQIALSAAAALNFNSSIKLT